MLLYLYSYITLDITYGTIIIIYTYIMICIIILQDKKVVGGSYIFVTIVHFNFHTAGSVLQSLNSAITENDVHRNHVGISTLS